jgi:hypothetical protein
VLELSRKRNLANVKVSQTWKHRKKMEATIMVIRNRKSKKDKQHNGKRKRTKGQTETVHRKSKTSNMNPTKIWGELK